jgi:hypothetical protein
MDIGSLTECLPAKELSNFTAREFAVDTVPCASMEGFLQSLKEPDPAVQREMCLLVGFAAKKRGRKLDLTWKARQTLWWQGQEFGRRSEEFQGLLDRAFEALFTMNAGFRRSLASTGQEPLTHTIGKSDPSDTVLTEEEFCTRLMKLRERLANDEKGGV